MKVAILTSSEIGGAGVALAEIAGARGIDLVCVIQSDESDRRVNWKKRVRKIRKIGLLGALAGMRRRRWFVNRIGKSVSIEAERLRIPVVKVNSVNSADTIATLKKFDVQLGISLGNGYISSKVFGAPVDGFINYHGELLPEYPGAQSIIWPIYFGENKTGFTIHRIDKGIDTGQILYRREVDIVFRSKLRYTVQETEGEVHPLVPLAFKDLLENWTHYTGLATSQKPERHFTTPTFGQFMRMSANNKRLWKASRAS